MSVKTKDLKKIKRVYFVGIGGAGVSAMAQLFLEKGIYVSGSDLKMSTNTDRLAKLKVPIAIGLHKAANINNKIDLVVYTNDTDQQNPEIIRAKKLKIDTLSYPQALPIILESKKIIGISGTHGKTTTTAMVGDILLKSGWDPTVVAGSYIESLKGNARLGEGEYAVVEADEYKKAFLNYIPKIAVVTNVEADHLNFYKNLDNIRKAFSAFIAQVPRGGLVLANGDDPGARMVTETRDCCVLWYGLDSRSELRATNVNLKGPVTTFKVDFHDRSLGSFKLRAPGAHNVKNALAAIGVGSHLGVPVKDMQNALENFSGTWRRFEYKGEEKGITVIDDFAHHPTELTATLKAARNRFGKRRLVAIFQPHFYGRLKDFFKEFAIALTLADLVIIPPVFYVPGRENIGQLRSNYNNQTLSEAVNHKGTRSIAAPDMNAALAAGMATIKKGDVVLTIGAGDVTELGPKILKALSD